MSMECIELCCVWLLNGSRIDRNAPLQSDHNAYACPMHTNDAHYMFDLIHIVAVSAIEMQLGYFLPPNPIHCPQVDHGKQPQAAISIEFALSWIAYANKIWRRNKFIEITGKNCEDFIFEHFFSLVPKIPSFFANFFWTIMHQWWILNRRNEEEKHRKFTTATVLKTYRAFMSTDEVWMNYETAFLYKNNIFLWFGIYASDNNKYINTSHICWRNLRTVTFSSDKVKVVVGVAVACCSRSCCVFFNFFVFLFLCKMYFCQCPVSSYSFS